MYTFATLREIEATLEPYFPSRLKRHAYTTEHIEQFMEFLGDPQNLPKAIHIAGTSGKTSTAYYTAALLKQAGKRVGLLVSPHTEQLNERVQINLEPLSEQEFCREFSLFMDIVAKSDLTLTYAEILYGFAYWEFARHHVEYIVVEVGMGGLLDATNVIDREDKVCVITDIGMDHTNVLGNTLTDITKHKAGIIRWHNTVFCHPQQTEIMHELRNACSKSQADLHVVDMQNHGAYNFLPLFQQRNFNLALHAVQYITKKTGEPILSKQKITEAAHTKIPARMEIIEYGNRVLILDGAHNVQKLRALRESMEAYFPGQPTAVLVAFGEGRGRQAKDMLAEIAPLASHLIITVLPRHKSIPPKDLAEAAHELGIESIDIIGIYSSAYDALMSASESVLLVTGSFYLLEHIRPLALAKNS